VDGAVENRRISQLARVGNENRIVDACHNFVIDLTAVGATVSRTDAGSEIGLRQNNLEDGAGRQGTGLEKLKLISRAGVALIRNRVVGIADRCIKNGGVQNCGVGDSVIQNRRIENRRIENGGVQGYDEIRIQYGGVEDCGIEDRG